MSCSFYSQNAINYTMSPFKGLRFTSKDVARVRRIRKIATTPTRSGERLYYGDLTLKKENFLPFPGITRPKKVFLKPAPKGKRQAEELAIRQRIRELGLPIPKAGIVEMKENREVKPFWAIEPFVQKGGRQTKLIAINVSSEGGLTRDPGFLDRLRPDKDGPLIRQLAKDTAALINNGIGFWEYDFFGFYPSAGKQWKRVIMDTEELYWADTLKKKKQSTQLAIHAISNVWLHRSNPSDRAYDCYRIFMDTLQKNLTSDTRP